MRDTEYCGALAHVPSSISVSKKMRARTGQEERAVPATARACVGTHCGGRGYAGGPGLTSEGLPDTAWCSQEHNVFILTRKVEVKK